MTYYAKAVLIQTFLLLASGIISITLMIFFKSRELENFAQLSLCFLTTPFGLYILFGKYVYLKGVVITNQVRIVSGLFFLLIVPVVYFIIWCVRK